MHKPDNRNLAEIFLVLNKQEAFLFVVLLFSLQKQSSLVTVSS